MTHCMIPVLGKKKSGRFTKKQAYHQNWEVSRDCRGGVEWGKKGELAVFI